MSPGSAALQRRRNLPRRRNARGIAAVAPRCCAGRTTTARIVNEVFACSGQLNQYAATETAPARRPAGASNASTRGPTRTLKDSRHGETRFLVRALIALGLLAGTPSAKAEAAGRLRRTRAGGAAAGRTLRRDAAQHGPAPERRAGRDLQLRPDRLLDHPDDPAGRHHLPAGGRPALGAGRQPRRQAGRATPDPGRATRRRGLPIPSVLRKPARGSSQGPGLGTGEGRWQDRRSRSSAPGRSAARSPISRR